MSIKIPFVSRYFSWLHNNAPEGAVEIYPEVSENYESSVPGIRVIGDLTGLPLLKFAVESGTKVVKEIERENGKRNSTDEKRDSSVYDVLIVGAGPAGVSAGIECKKLNYNFIILEANDPFHTVKSYPKAKPIFAEPEDLQTESEIAIQNGTKESLLKDLQDALTKWKLPIQTKTNVARVQKENFGFTIFTEN
ncbi:FAD-binding protein, partial [Leptospira barantonii]